MIPTKKDPGYLPFMVDPLYICGYQAGERSAGDEILELNRRNWGLERDLSDANEKLRVFEGNLPQNLHGASSTESSGISLLLNSSGDEELSIQDKLTLAKREKEDQVKRIKELEKEKERQEKLKNKPGPSNFSAAKEKSKRKRKEDHDDDDGNAAKGPPYTFRASRV